LLQRLCFDFGALGLAPQLAQLAASHARGTMWELDAIQDLLHALTVRSDATDGVGPPPPMAELSLAISAVVAGPYLQLARAQRLLGRALATCAQTWLLGALRPGERACLRSRWGDADALLREALEAHGRAVDLDTAALRSASASMGGNEAHGEVAQDCAEEALAMACAGGIGSRRAALELGRSLAALGEFWHSVAYVSAQLLADGECPLIVGVDGEAAANAALDTFEDAVRLFRVASSDDCPIEVSRDYAEILLGYGKVILCFFEDLDSCKVESPLEQALKLYEELLGRSHPRTCHLRKVCLHI